MANKQKLLIVFGGQSGEHEVSLESAASVFKAVDRNKYDVYLLGVTKEGKSLMVDTSKLQVGHSKEARDLQLSASTDMLPVLQKDSTFVVSSQSIGEIKPDVVLPLIHGTTGEDGVLQGYLEFLGIPYVGTGVLGSSLCMDKDMCKRVLRDSGIPVVPYLKFYQDDLNRLSEVRAEVEKTLGYPCFVKPANMGSSVGIHKIKSAADFEEKVRDAFKYDEKILIEKGLNVKEYEVAVLGNSQPKASCVGEIIPTHEFYSYEAKYLDQNGAHLKIPAELDSALAASIQKIACEAFRVLECSGLARIDFFWDKDSGEVYLNEVNTLPGFTAISMYPKLWAASGIAYSELLNQLLDLAQERHNKRKGLKRTFTA